MRFEKKIGGSIYIVAFIAIVSSCRQEKHPASLAGKWEGRITHVKSELTLLDEDKIKGNLERASETNEQKQNLDELYGWIKAVNNKFRVSEEDFINDLHERRVMSRVYLFWLKNGRENIPFGDFTNRLGFEDSQNFVPTIKKDSMNNSEIFTMNISETKSNKLIGNGTVHYLDNISGKAMDSPVQFSSQGINYDHPAVYIDIYFDSDPEIKKFQLQGIVNDKLDTIDTKLFTWTTSSTDFSLYANLKFRRVNK